MIEKDAIGIGMKIAAEAITNIRTVASLSKIFTFLQTFFFNSVKFSFI